MKCSSCNIQVDDGELKLIEGDMVCKSCFKAQTDDALVPNMMRKTFKPKVKHVSKKSSRVGRVEYAYFMLITWLLLPVLVQVFLMWFVNNPVANNLLNNDVHRFLVGFTPMQVNSNEGAYGFYYDVFALWFIQAPLSVVFSDGRVKDIGWRPWLAFVLWLPLVNLILCFKKGGDGENGYGIPAPRASLVARIIVFGAPILIPIILIICPIYIHGAS